MTYFGQKLYIAGARKLDSVKESVRHNKEVAAKAHSFQPVDLSWEGVVRTSKAIEK